MKIVPRWQNRFYKPSLEQLESRIVLNAGDLDPTFGNGGIVNFNFLWGDNFGDAEVQGDGKIVMAGHSEGDFALARFHADGSIDNSFGINGRVQTDFGNGEGIRGLVLRPDGRILAAGIRYDGQSRIALAQYNPDGSLDTTFGVGGRVTTDILNGSDVANDVVLLPDGRFVVVGSAQPNPTYSTSYVLAVRYLPNGSLDTSFGTNGWVTTNLGSADAHANAAVAQPDGRIVSVGTRSTSGGLFGIAALRYDDNGSLDMTFDGDGIVITNYPDAYSGYSGECLNGVALQPDGKIVGIGNYLNANQNADFAIVRYLTNGSLDPSFDGDGRASLNLVNTNDGGEAVAFQPDGKILIAGHRGVPGGSHSIVARYQVDGTLDPTFGPGILMPGVVATDIVPNDNDGFHWVTMLPTGRLLAAGQAGGSSNSNWGIARYEGVVPPVANAGGPYSVVEGGSVQLDASATFDRDQPAATLVYQWDLDSDGVFGETGTSAAHGAETGMTPTFLTAGLDGSATYTIRLRVTNANLLTHEAEATVNVLNAPPVPQISGPVDGVPGQMRDYKIWASDPSFADELTGFHFAVDWEGDGSVDMKVVPATSFSASHAYTEAGTYSLTIRTTDRDGAVGVLVHPLVISKAALQSDPFVPSEFLLAAGGTLGNDKIEFYQANTGVGVYWNGTDLGTFAAPSRILAFGQAGHDALRATPNITVPVWLHGGDGNDELIGGSNNDVLLGDAGNDRLYGVSGRDLLVGGVGADSLDGGADDDILLAGFTTFDAYDYALWSIMREWTSNHDYLTRIRNLTDGSGSPDRLNGSYFLRAGLTVLEDDAEDRLAGGSGRDWFFFQRRRDWASDMMIDEIFANELP